MDDRSTLAPPSLVASKIHLALLLLLLLGLAAAGFLAQHQALAAPPNAASAGQLADHSQAIRFYLTAMVVDWILFVVCFVGVHRRGGTLASISGDRWHSVKDVLIDLGIAVLYWVLWEAVAYGVHYVLDLFAPAAASASIGGLLPKSIVDVVLWILLCGTAGFCEEFIFRGYLQKQFRALTGSLVAAVLLQGLVFGITHGYQGWKNVVVISVLGSLSGALAAWRGNLRANMISHAWSDAWEGWLKIFIFH